MYGRMLVSKVNGYVTTYLKEVDVNWDASLILKNGSDIRLSQGIQQIQMG